MERCPSGLRSTLGKRVYVYAYRGFESLPLRYMYYAYILISDKDKGFYYGSTENIETRISRHNAGSVRSTKHRRPLTLHHFEEYKTRSEAVQRERYFKSKAGNIWLKQQGIIYA